MTAHDRDHIAESYDLIASFKGKALINE